MYHNRKPLTRLPGNHSRWLIIALFILTLHLQVNSTELELNVTPSLFGISEYEFNSSAVCRKCHPHHYEMWSHSMHALSTEDPIFNVAFLQAQIIQEKRVQEQCLSCHAPLALSNKDYSLAYDYTKEGVSCDICHTVTAVHIGRSPSPYDNNRGAVKYGPLEPGANPAHNSQKSDLFKSAVFCGGCHDYVNEYGVIVMGTYLEWQEGPYPAEGIHCQNCHMPLTMRPAWVTLAGDTSAELAHDHQFQGGHSQINLKHAASLDITTQLEGRSAKINVILTNKESGHKLPTGMPGRKVLLNIKVLDQNNQLITQLSRIYRKVLVDKDGAILEGNSIQLLNSVRIYSDNRIAPKEKRKEEFIIDIPPNVTNIMVLGELIYEYETPVMYQQKIQTEMAMFQKNYPIDAKSPLDQKSFLKTRWKFALILFLVLISIVVFFNFYIRKKKSSI